MICVSFASYKATSSLSSSASAFQLFEKDFDKKFPAELLVRLFIDAATEQKIQIRFAAETSVVDVRQSGVLWLDAVNAFDQDYEEGIIIDKGNRLVEKNIKKFVLKSVFCSDIRVVRKKDSSGALRFSPNTKIVLADEKDVNAGFANQVATDKEGQLLDRRFLECLFIGPIEEPTVDPVEQLVFLNGITGLMKQFKKIRNKFFSRFV